MNDACNIMFNFMRDNKLGKKLKSTIIETILATYHINQVFGYSAIYIQQYDNGRYEGEMVDGKREGYGKFYFITGDFMKENLKIIVKKDMENMYIVIKMYMKENIKMAKFMEKVNIHM